MKIVDRAEHPDRTANPKEKPESCYCSALPKGSSLCLPRYTRWLAGRRRAEQFTFTLGPLKACAEPLLDSRTFEHPASETWPPTPPSANSCCDGLEHRVVWAAV